MPELVAFAALTVIGTVGMFAALPSWYGELQKTVQLEEQTGRSATLRERRGMVFWAVPVVVFGIAGAIGDVGLIVLLTRTVVANL